MDEVGQTFPDYDSWAHPERWMLAVDVIGRTAVEAGSDKRDRQLAAGAAFEELLDPQNSLPKVRLELHPEPMRQTLKEAGWLTYDVFDADGQHIGYCNLQFTSDYKFSVPEVMLARDIHDRYICLPNGEYMEQAQMVNKGYGQAIYKLLISEAIQQGFGFKNAADSGLGKMGHEFWMRLVDKGVAKITHEGELRPDSGRSYDYSTYQFEILSPEELTQE